MFSFSSFFPFKLDFNVLTFFFNLRHVEMRQYLSLTVRLLRDEDMSFLLSLGRQTSVLTIVYDAFNNGSILSTLEKSTPPFLRTTVITTET